MPGTNSHLGIERTSMCADSGDNGFPSSQTTKSETSSTTPAQREPSPLHELTSKRVRVMGVGGRG